MLWEVTFFMSCSNAIIIAEPQGSAHALHNPAALNSRTTTCEVVATASNYPSGTGNCTSCYAIWHGQPASFMFMSLRTCCLPVGNMHF
jgi:hypothetical protein